jgi:ABC-type transport system involved in multi-copper enzyme maturation permease subunit
MVRQTLSLFRYLLLGVINRRLLVLQTILVVVAMLLAAFISELAIINSAQISSALLGDFLRYSLVFLALLLVTCNVAEDYESKQFERLLTMPLSRWQYVAAQVMVVITVSTVLSLPVAVVISFAISIDIAVYWAVALWLEIILMGLIGLLGILSLEKVTQAVFFAIAIYLLAKVSPVIGHMLEESVKSSDGSLSRRFVESIFKGVLHVMPGPQAFAQNNVFFEPSLPLGKLVGLLSDQLVAVTICSGFLVAVCLVDFYRKEFNL